MKRRLEVCVDNLEDACIAAENGADRLELCGALAVGGITPPPGLVRGALELCGVPCVALVRPRAGDFLYTARERESMRHDVESLRESGCAGVVVGALTSDARLDVGVLAELIDAAGGIEVALHRAFDAALDLEHALEAAVELGLCRILTSGGAPNAPAGSAKLAELVHRAAGRITVMAGGGVRAANAVELVRASGVGELHASCGGPQPSPMESRPADLVLGRAEGGDADNWRVDPRELCALRAALDFA